MKKTIKRKVIMWVLGLGSGMVPVVVGILGLVLIIGAVSAANTMAGNAVQSASAAAAAAAGTSCQITPSAITVTIAGPTNESDNPYTRGPNPVTDKDDDQLYNAAIILSVGAKLGLSKRDQQIALMTAMQESRLRNLHYGDLDSEGLFQQRPSAGWGTPDEVTDPVYAANKFYEALVKIANRDTMSMNDVAQAVQISGYPDAYGPHEEAALAVLNAIYADTAAATCGIKGNGLTLDQANKFMAVYQGIDPDAYGINTCGCGNCLANCVSFSLYFVRRYTTSTGNAATGNGRDVAANMIEYYGLTDGGHVPRVYAIFSIADGVTMCGDSPCGHTGVVLGIDAANDIIITGEAACGNLSYSNQAYSHSLAAFSTDAYSYAYTDSIFKGDPIADLPKS